MKSTKEGLKLIAENPNLPKVPNRHLVMLPCNVGDTVYTNMHISGSYLHKKSRPYPVKVVFIGLNNDVDMGGGFINVVFQTEHMWQFEFSSFGKQVFITKSEAEKSLEEL